MHKRRTASQVKVHQEVIDDRPVITEVIFRLLREQQLINYSAGRKVATAIIEVAEDGEDFMRNQATVRLTCESYRVPRFLNPFRIKPNFRKRIHV